MNTSMESLSIEIESTAKESTNSVDRLIQQLDKLRTSLQNVINESTNFSKLKSNLESVSKGVSAKASAKATTPKQSDYGSYESQLYKLGITGDLGDSKYATLTQSVRTANSELDKYVLNNNKVVTVSKSTKNGVDNVKVSVKELGNNTKNTTSLWGALTSEFAKSVAKIGALYVGLKRLASKVADFVKEAANYEESLNLFTVTLGENAKEGMQWVTKFSNALYLDPAGVMQYMGQFNSLTKGLGVGADKAYLMSKNLTQLTYDLASFKNLDFDTAFRKLQSAMSGEIEPLRNVGVALSQNTLQELANSMGINQRVAEMSEANKAQLRYIQILKSTSDWQTDMGRTLVTPANALRIVKQQFTLLARAIGSIFIPIVMEVIPYIMVLTEILTKLAKKIASFLGYEIQDIDYSYITKGMDDISGGIENIGNSADKTTKKLNTMLAPFDELNVVQNQTDKAGGGSGLGGAGDLLDLPLPEYDALAGLTDKMNKKMEDAKKKLKDMIPIVAGLGTAFATWKIGKSIANFMKWWDGLTGGGKNVARVALGISLVITGMTLKFSGDKDILNDKTLVQGIAKQIGGSALIGGGAALITKNIPLGVVIGSISLIHSGGKTSAHGEKEQALAGFIEQGLGIAGVAGASFKMSGGNPVITLAVTGIVSWANVLFEAKDLLDMKPTWEELYNAIFVELNPFHDLGTSLGDLIYDFGEGVDEMNKGISDFFTGIGNWVSDTAFDISDKVDQMNQDIADFFTDIGNKIGDFVSDAPKKLGIWWEDTKRGFKDTWDDVKKKTGDAFENAKTTISNKTSDIKNSLSTTWDSIKTIAGEKWETIKNTVSTKFTNIKGAASDTFEKVKTTISDKWTSAKDWLSNNIGTKASWKEKFSNILNAASDILRDLKDKFTNWKAKLKMPHIIWDSNGTKVKGTLKKILETLNLPTTLPKLSVSWYAEGGFPRDGEFFVANENGPEMVGKIGNRSAVANNNQIEASLTNALVTALDNYDFGGGNSPTTIYIGNKKVYEGYGDYVNGENDRYGTNTIRI